MKARNLGRLELLAWINDMVEADYPKVEMCSDGIAYCQVMDAIHPSMVPLQKLNFAAKNKDDNSRNLKVLDDVLTKLKLNKQINTSNLANGKFQFNMEFLQWLYDYTMKTSPNIGAYYNGYERRLEAYKKQNGIPSHSHVQVNMLPHLIPNQSSYRKKDRQVEQYSEEETKGGQNAFLQNLNNKRQQQPQQYQAPQLEHQQDLYSNSILQTEGQANTMKEVNEQRKAQLQDLVQSLESELTQQLFNHKMFLEDIQQIEEERNFYYQKLRLIEEECKKRKKAGAVKSEIMQILSSTPEDFIENTQHP